MSNCLTIPRHLFDALPAYVKDSLINNLKSEMPEIEQFRYPADIQADYSVSSTGVLNAFRDAHTDRHHMLRKFVNEGHYEYKETLLRAAFICVQENRVDDLKEIMSFASEHWGKPGMVMRSNLYFDITPQKPQYSNLLTLSAQTGNLDCVEVLLQHGAEPTYSHVDIPKKGNSLRRFYSNPLDCLIHAEKAPNRIEMVKLFMKYGANIYRKTGLNTEVQEGDSTIENMLKCGGAIAQIALDDLQANFGNNVSKALKKKSNLYTGSQKDTIPQQTHYIEVAALTAKANTTSTNPAKPKPGL